jgi:hypothetical protein
LNFTNETSFGRFMAGLRALRRYSEEAEKDQPNRALLTQDLSLAHDNLNYCATNYPNDFVPLYSLGLVLTMKNQFVYAQALADRNTQAEAAHIAFLGLPAPRLWPLLDHAADLFNRAMNGSALLADAARFNLAHVYAKRDDGTNGTDDLIRALELLEGHSAQTRSALPMRGARLNWLKGEEDQMRERDLYRLRFQVRILRLFVEARLAFRRNPGSLADSLETARQGMAGEHDEVAHSMMPPPAIADLLADAWTKMGYLTYEAAMTGSEVDEGQRTELLANAQRELGQALLRKPNWNPPQVYMAQVLQALGRFEEASNFLSAVLGDGAN